MRDLIPPHCDEDDVLDWEDSSLSGLDPVNLLHHTAPNNKVLGYDLAIIIGGLSSRPTVVD